MTSFLTGGMGSLNSNPRSRESAALEASRLQGKSFVNKDFVKNIAFLNQTADTHTAWLQKLQKGVDEANQNALEQIQGFWGDLFVLFAGLEPTGIDVGDVKYIIQGLGAFLGINPDTPFPLNLFEAAWHFFSTYVIPLDQFTDVIFDAILAWAEELGLSEEFINSLEELMEAIELLGATFTDLFNSIGDLLGAFGFLGFTSTSGIGELWDALVDLIDGLALEPLKPVLSLLADLGVPFINALTAIVNGANTFLVPITNIIRGPQNILVSAQFTDSDSFVAQNGWSRDPFVGRTFEGSAKATANGTVRELISLEYPAVEGQRVDQAIWVSWASASYTGIDHATLAIRLYNGETLVDTIALDSITFTSTNQVEWQQLSGNHTIPDGVTHFRVSLKVNSNVMTGNVWFDDAEAKTTGGYAVDLFGGVLDMFGLGFLDDLIGLNPFDIWSNIITGIFNPLQLIEDFGIRDFVQDLVDALISVVRGIPFVGGTLADWIEDLTDWFDDTELTAAVASDAKLGVEATQTALVQNITGTTDPLPGDPAEADAAVEAAVASQTESVVSTAAQVQALTSAQIGGAFSGTIALEEFEYVNLTGVDPLLWQSSFLDGSDAIAKIKVLDGHNAGMEWSAGQTNSLVTEFLHYIGPGRVSTTDYQKVTLVVGTAAQYPGFFDFRRAKWYVYGRVSADGLTWVRGWVDCYGGAGIDYRIAGGPIQELESEPGTAKNPGPAAFLTLECGYQGSPRIFRVLVNNSVVCSASDNGDITMLGEDYREHGWGQGTDGLNSGNITQYSMNDNKPAAVIGSGVRLFRSSTFERSQPLNSIAKLSDDTWDSISQRTPDITVNLTTGGITINTTGWYLFYWRYNYDSHGATPSNGRYAGVLFKGENAIAAGAFRGAATSLIMEPLDTLPVYVEAGDEFFFGIVTSNLGSMPIAGDADGLYTYGGAALMNNRVTA